MATEGLQIYQSDAQVGELKPWRSAAEIKAQRDLILDVMRTVMKENIHYGTIPGCDKPSLWKPGAEVLFSTFRIAADPMVEDLSTHDEARFRVTVHATSASGAHLGSSVGECSTNEEKYKWRRVTCTEEWEATSEDRRRLKWKKGEGKAYSTMQVRTEIADVRNTALKIGHKRGYVSLALQVTAASDVFTQDVEDFSAEMREVIAEQRAEQTGWEDLPDTIRRKPAQTTSAAQQDTPVKRSPPAVVGTGAGVTADAPVSSRPPQQARPPIQQPKPAAVRTITDGQARRFYAIRMQHGRTNEETKEFLQSVCGVSDDRQMPATFYERACRWAETGKDF